MKEKTKIWIVIAVIFAISVIVVAFGSFIESQRELNPVAAIAGKQIQPNTEPERLLLRKTENASAIKLEEKN